MTEARAIALIMVGMSLLLVGTVLSMAALGVAGVVLSLGAIVPAALGAYGMGRVIMYYGESGRKHREARAEKGQRSQTAAS